MSSSECSQTSFISDDESWAETSVVSEEPASYKAYNFGEKLSLHENENSL